MVVYSNRDEIVELETAFKAWCARENSVRLLVSVTKDKLEEVTAAINATGGTIEAGNAP